MGSNALSEVVVIAVAMMTIRIANVRREEAGREMHVKIKTRIDGRIGWQTTPCESRCAGSVVLQAA